MPIHLFAAGFALLSVVALVALIALWGISHRPGGIDWTLNGPSAKFILSSRNGRLVLAMAGHDMRSMRWGYQRVDAGVSWLINDEEDFFTADLWSWGFALPHWVFGLLLCIAPAWWWMVWRDHAETSRRAEHGLCRHCGYDVSHSRERCPECGERLATLRAFTAPTTTSPAAAGSAIPTR